LKGTLKERFESKYVPIPGTGCWIWTGATVPRGYGKLSVRTSFWEYAHRISWQLYRGAIQDGMYVCHKCDTPSCVNPDHLFIGSAKDNNDDMIAKNRNCIGDARSDAKLTKKQVEFIYASKLPGVWLSKEFGVSTGLISGIRRGKKWNCVTGTEVSALTIRRSAQNM